MKILLCADIEKLGWLGDVIDVKNGYARNYLLPQGLGVVPTEYNIKSLSNEKAKRSEVRRVAMEKLELVIQAVEGAEAVVAAKANEQGHLFGSVSENDIASNLREQGFEISDDMIKLSEHIKETGEHEVTVKVSADLTAAIKLVVVSQDETVESIDEDSQE